MSEQSPQSPASAPEKPWYMKWWVWAIAAVLVVGGINAVINPSQGNLSGAPQPTQSVPAEPTASETPAQAAPLDLEAFLTGAGVAFDKVQMSPRKVLVYVPTETSREQAQQIANDAMLYMCAHAKQPPGFVKVDDNVSIYTPNYHAADHPIAYAQDEICQG